MNSIQSFQIDDPGYSISGLQPEHVEALQTLCERCADYTLVVEGEAVSPTAAQEIMQDAPPGRSLDGKFLYGIFDPLGSLAGVLEGMRHYPEENVWWIGLLMLAPETRGNGIGRKIIQNFFEYVHSMQGTSVMLGVVEGKQIRLSLLAANGIRTGPPDRAASVRKEDTGRLHDAKGIMKSLWLSLQLSS